MLKVNEVFYSIQGEGALVGTPSVFVRLSGCNLRCKFCDTTHEDSDEMTVDQVVLLVSMFKGVKSVVITGGEPLMQDDTEALVVELIESDHVVMIETNGTQTLSEPVEDLVSLHTCVSPKVPFDKIKIMYPDSMKLLYPFLPGLSIEDYEERSNFVAPVFIQPLDNNAEYVKQIAELLVKYPDARLSVQVHKLFGLR